EMRHRGPDLRAVDDPLVAVTFCTRGEARDVGPRAGLAEELTPELLRGEDRTQEAGALVLGPARDDCGTTHADAHRIARPRVAPAGSFECLVDDLLQFRRSVEAAVADRVVHARQPGVELRAEKAAHVVVGVTSEQLLDARTDLLLGHRRVCHLRHGAEIVPTGPSRLPGTLLDAWKFTRSSVGWVR